jgi:aminopeptidase YwaD
VKDFRRGVRAALFSVEEWALTGSAQYVASLSHAERGWVALNVNLDCVGGSPNLTALTSGFAALEPFLLRVAETNGVQLRTVRPLYANSDHANFALAGIPAFRLVAGFDDPNANVAYVLTPSDTRNKVRESELRQAAMLSAAIVAEACDALPQDVLQWRQEHCP